MGLALTPSASLGSLIAGVNDPAITDSLKTATSPEAKTEPTQGFVEQPPKNEAEKKERVRGWQEYFAAPGVQTALAQFGTSLLSGRGLGEAIGDTGGALARRKETEAADLEAQRAADIEERRIRIAEGRAGGGGGRGGGGGAEGDPASGELFPLSTFISMVTEEDKTRAENSLPGDPYQGLGAAGIIDKAQFLKAAQEAGINIVTANDAYNNAGSAAAWSSLNAELDGTAGGTETPVTGTTEVVDTETPAKVSPAAVDEEVKKPTEDLDAQGKELFNKIKTAKTAEERDAIIEQMRELDTKRATIKPATPTTDENLSLATRSFIKRFNKKLKTMNTEEAIAAAGGIFRIRSAADKQYIIDNYPDLASKLGL